MIKLAFLFRSAPYGSSNMREGFDALLAASAFCEPEELAVFFIDDGILNLRNGQQAETVLQRDVTSSLKLLTLYDIEQRYVCLQSLQQFGFQVKDFIIDMEMLSRQQLLDKIKTAEKILTF